MDELCQRLMDRHCMAPRMLVSVAGAPGAGKSTLSQRLVQHLNGTARMERAICVPMDGFHYPKAHLNALPNREEAFVRRGVIWSFDVEGIPVMGMAVKRGVNEVIHAPGWDHAVGDPLPEALTIRPSHDIVIFEGLYLHADEPVWRDIFALMDARIFLHCPKDLAMQRVAARHLACGIASSPEDAERRVQRNDSLNYDFVISRNMLTDLNVDSSSPDYVLLKRVAQQNGEHHP